MSLKSCPQCSEEMILTRATNFGEEYLYCKKCKKELAEMPQEVSPVYPDWGNTKSPKVLTPSCNHTFDSDLMCTKCGQHWYSLPVMDMYAYWRLSMKSPLYNQPDEVWEKLADADNICIEYEKTLLDKLTSHNSPNRDTCNLIWPLVDYLKTVTPTKYTTLKIQTGSKIPKGCIDFEAAIKLNLDKYKWWKGYKCGN